MRTPFILLVGQLFSDGWSTLYCNTPKKNQDCALVDTMTTRHRTATSTTPPPLGHNKKGSVSKASAILGAHKPLPLAELLLGTTSVDNSGGETKMKRNILVNYILAFSFIAITFVVLLSRASTTGPSTKLWMEDPQLVSLLAKTPKTKDDRYTVFVTHSNGIHTTVVYGQCEKSATHAMQRAYSKIRINSDDNDDDDDSKYYIKVDAVMSIESVNNFNYVKDKIPSDAGFAVGDWSSLVFLHEQVTGSALLNPDGYLRWDHIGKIWANTMHGRKKWPDTINYEESTVPMDFIRTKAVFFDGKTSYNLLKGKRVVSLHDMTPAYLKESAQMAGDYLTRQVHADGTMVYIYRPRSDTVPTEEEYNLTRHAGTAYAMALLYKSYPNPALLQATQDVLDYLVDVQMTDCPLAYKDGESAKCIINEVYHGHKWTQLGVNSLALLAMAEYMESAKDPVRYWEASKELAKWIAGTQREDGSFVQDQDIETNHLDEKAYVRYFPGEAAFAMARLYNTASAMKVKVHDSWKTVASNAMDYIVTRESDVSDDEFANDHWMMYALAEMAPWHWTEDMLHFAVRTGKLAQERQIRHHEDDSDQDRNGIYIRPGKNGEDTQSLSSCATATKSEGLCAVYPVIQQRAPESAKMILDSAKWGIRYQLGTQMRPEQSIYMKKPWRSMGALSKNILDTETRNDYSQHNLCSFLCLARVLEADGGGDTSAVQ